MITPHKSSVTNDTSFASISILSCDCTYPRIEIIFIEPSTRNFCLDNADNDVAIVDSSVYGTSRTAALAALHTPNHPKANTL